MRRVFSIVACLLAVLWLPATLHCGLETAGLWVHEHGEDAGELGCVKACGNEACAVVEDGAYKNPAGIFNAPAPLLALCVMHQVMLRADALFIPGPTPERVEPPLELARTWQFTARMALPPGAPSIA